MQIESGTQFDLQNEINCKSKASEALTKLKHEQEAQGPQWSPEHLCINSIQHLTPHSWFINFPIPCLLCKVFK